MQKPTAGIGVFLITRVLRSVSLIFALLSSLAAHAGFPDDFSDVTWIDPDISSWSQTSTISVSVEGSILRVNDTKKAVWPARFHSILQNDCCNRSLWIFIKYQGRWYATTFEYMRFNQDIKQSEAVRGRQIKRLPFFGGGFEWEPANGEVYGFMTSGMARFNLDNVNVRERSNVFLYRWGVGPTDNVDFEEVPRNSHGGTGEEEPEPTPEPEAESECQLPEPEPVSTVNNQHIYDGTATGQLVVSGENNGEADFNDSVRITLNDDRSLSFTVSDETFSTTLNQDGSFSGTFSFDIGDAGLCIVSVNVSGTIDGKTANGSASGRESCLGNDAVFTATFNAASVTEPDFIDQRVPSQPSLPSQCRVNLAPLLDLLLGDGA